MLQAVGHDAGAYDEDRADAIGQNGNEGLYYPEGAEALDVAYQDDHAGDPPRPQVTALQVVIHPAGTNWLAHDESVLLELRDEGAGPYVTLSGLTGPLMISDPATLDAIRAEAARMLRAGGEG